MGMYVKAEPLETETPANPAYQYSTSEGRQYLPDILQDVVSEKAIVGFKRNKRTVRAVLVPLEAVFLLAGLDTQLTEDAKIRIRNTARALLDAQK